MPKIKMLSLFSGIGSPEMALRNIGVNVELLDAVEIDRAAIKSYNLIHGTNYETNSVIEYSLPEGTEVDLVFHGSPCTDFSTAGKQLGGDKNSQTRSSLLWETVRIVDESKPKVVVWENVKAVLSKKHKHNFEGYLQHMEDMGYRNYYQVLNAKYFDTPQNRERIFVVSIRDDLYPDFKMPTNDGRKITKVLSDIVEAKVDAKNHFSDNAFTNYIHNTNFKYYLEKAKGLKDATFTVDAANKCIYVDKPEGKKIKSLDFIAAGMSTGQTTGELARPLHKAVPGLNYATKQTIVMKATDETFYTLTTVEKDNNLVIAKTDKKFKSDTQIKLNIMIRKLSPLEVWRGQGFSDDDFKKVDGQVARAALFKQVGNSIAVKCLEAIFTNLYFPATTATEEAAAETA